MQDTYRPVLPVLNCCIVVACAEVPVALATTDSGGIRLGLCLIRESRRNFVME